MNRILRKGSCSGSLTGAIREPPRPAPLTAVTLNPPRAPRADIPSADTRAFRAISAAAQHAILELTDLLSSSLWNPQMLHDIVDLLCDEDADRGQGQGELVPPELVDALEMCVR